MIWGVPLFLETLKYLQHIFGELAYGTGPEELRCAGPFRLTPGHFVDLRFFKFLHTMVSLDHEEAKARIVSKCDSFVISRVFFNIKDQKGQGFTCSIEKWKYHHSFRYRSPNHRWKKRSSL